MPFNREWDSGTRTFIVNRNRTGTPKPSPDTGTAQADDGSIIADSGTLEIPPATPIPVKMPGPREPIIDGATGLVSPRWWRFLEELWRRTGALEDNINSVERFTTGSATTGSLTLTGAAPTVQETHNSIVPVGSLTATGNIAEPALSSPVEAPGTGSLTLTGSVPTVA